MINKIFVPVFIMISFVSSAMAATWSSDGYMRESSTYFKAATASHMLGVDGSEGNNVIFAVAQYGSCPAEYPNSVSGATSLFGCYRDCAQTDVKGLADGGTVSGTVLYGDIGKCTASACADGYDKMDADIFSNFTNASPQIGLFDATEAYIAPDANFGGAVSGDIDFSWGRSNVVVYDSNYMGWVGYSAGNGFLAGTAALLNSDEEFLLNSSSGYLSASGSVLSVGNNCFCEIQAYKNSSGRIFHVFSTPINIGYSGSLVTCATYCASYVSTGPGGGSADGGWVNDLYARSSLNMPCAPNMFSITYSCGTGEWAVDDPVKSQSVVLGEEFTAALGSNCAETGHKFKEWSVLGKGDRVLSGESTTWTYTAPLTFEAVWLPISYKVRFNANVSGATGTMSDQTHVFGGSLALTPNAFTNGNKMFKGWATSPTSTTVAYTNGQEIHSLATEDGAIVDLYALWDDCPACTPSDSATCGDVTAPAGVCTYTGTCKSGYSGLTVSGTTPSCTPNTITIIYNSNGHGSAPAQTSCTYGSNFTTASAITGITGYVFSKWGLNSKLFDADTSVKCTKTNLGVYTGTVTLKANWTANEVTIRWTEVPTSAGGNADGIKESSVFYGDDIVTPAAVNSKLGKIFYGWKFSKTNP